MLNKTKIISLSIYLLFSLVCAVLFCWAFTLYQGSKVYYLVYTFSFFILLISSLKNMKSYTYLFLAVFLWLGFWLKFTVHTIFNYQYIEPIGLFVTSGDSLDHTLLVASMGCWGAVLAWYFLSWFKFKSTIYIDSLNDKIVPSYYKKHRSIILPLLILSIISLAIFNLLLGVAQSGLVAQTKLMWPLNALIFWLLYIGFALIFTTVLWWEMLYKKSVTKIFTYALSDPFFCSISLFSRAIYIFHYVPVLLAFLINKEKLSIPVSQVKLIKTVILSGFLFVVSLHSVSVLRSHYYSGVDFSSYYSGSEIDKSHLPSSIKIFSGLLIDRWLGVEGVMAISSYPEKSLNLLKKAALEKSIIGQVGMYQPIAKAHYEKMDATRYSFGSIPGAVAFFYYSGSLRIVLLGMFIFTGLMIFSELMVSFLIKNPLLNSLYGMYAANTIAQFGLTPLGLLKQYFLIYVFILGLFIIQNKIGIKFKSIFKSNKNNLYLREIN